MQKEQTPLQDPYRSDMTQVAREALQQAKSAHLRLDQLEIDRLEKRVKELEKVHRSEYGFFRTNWNSFWRAVKDIKDDYFGPVLLVLLVLSGFAAIIFTVDFFNEKSDKVAREACTRANMTLVSNRQGVVKCIGPDRSVLTITYNGTTLDVPSTFHLTTVGN